MLKASLNARIRETRGKNAARELRREGRVPANLYGHGDVNQTLSVDALELEKLLAAISVENTLIDLSIEGGGTTRALVREVQSHPYRPEVYHLDLLQIHAGETLRLQIPVRLSGTPLGVRNSSGVLDQVLYDLEVECLPSNIPDYIEADVSHLEIGDSIRVRDVSAADVKILNDEDLPLASVIAPRAAVAETTAVEEPGVGGSIEPELIRERGEDAADVPADEQGSH